MLKADVIIIGAGIIGLSIAWQIARRSNLKVLVLEKGVGVGEGSTGASSAICRHRYSKTEMVNFARDGINAYRHWAEFTGLSQPRAQFHQHGVLWMPGQDSQWAPREQARLDELGVAAQVLDDTDLVRRFPALSACTQLVDVVLGQEHQCRGGGLHLLESEGGYVDPVAAAEDLVEACESGGVTVKFNAKVAEVSVNSGQVSGVTLADGAAIQSERVINAAGPWCNGFFRSLGLALPWRLSPVRIQVLYIDRPETLVGEIPASVDMTNGVYFRLQNRGQQLVVGSALEADEREGVENPDEFERFADERFTQEKLHALHHRIPSLPYRGAINSYCGLYTMNLDDVHPIIGPTSLPGFIAVNGFSGHGFKLAPAVGSMVAQWLTGISTSFDTQVAMDFFALDRKPIESDSKSVLA
jgi:sarcosine oxidase subunit beta